MKTPYQQALLDAQITLTRALAAQGLRSGAIATILSHHADICALLGQYQQTLHITYAEQTTVLLKSPSIESAWGTSCEHGITAFVLFPDGTFHCTICPPTDRTKELSSHGRD